MSFDWHDFQGVNAAYVLELYERFQRDPESVDSATRTFFRHWSPAEAATEGRAGTPAPSAQFDGRTLEVAVAARNLAQSIRRYGHLGARIDPLGSRPTGDPALLPETHGITDAELATLPSTLIGGPIAHGTTSMAEVVSRLRELYCSTTGFDFAHIFTPEERHWLREAV